MSDIALFRDYFRLVKPTEKNIKEWKDSVEVSKDSLQGSNRKGLEVTFEATHSALFNRNKKFYIPSRMKDGTSTFTNRKKPAKILKHHDMEKDPVGIITGAEYVDTVPEALLQDKNVQILLDSSNSITKQVLAAKRFLKTGIPFSDGWKGLGYIKLKGMLLDKDAIEQVLDGRFDAVSTSFSSPGHAYCSECQQNWAQDGFCEHELGVVYSDEEDGDDGVVCGLIPGVHNYTEMSLVNMDADPETVIMIGNQDQVKEFSVPADYWQNNSDEVQECAYSFRDYEEEITMAKPKKVTLSDAEKAVLEVIKELRSELDEEKAISFAKQISAMKNEDGRYPNQKESGLDEKTCFQYALETLETADQQVDADQICDGMQVELKLMFDNKEITEEEFKSADAELSAEQRKKISKSTFCGPDNSFPISDCAHVTAAKRLIGRYNGPGNKTEILASINRKANALGYEDSIKPEPEANPKPKIEIPSLEAISTLKDNEIKELFNAAEAELLTRNLKLERPCGKCAAHQDEATKAKDAQKVAEDQAAKLSDTLTVLRDELRNQAVDYKAQVDSYIDLGVKLATVEREHVALLGTLSGKFESVEKAMDSFSDSAFAEQKAVITDSFKIEEVLTKLNDGMTNQEPEADVEDPSVHINKDNNNFEGLSPSAQAVVDNIRDFIESNEIRQAKSFYDRMVIRKVLDPNQVPFKIFQQSKDAE